MNKQGTRRTTGKKAAETAAFLLFTGSSSTLSIIPLSIIPLD
ncbi:MAG TPA: hypothetical protein PLS28_00715 [Clostridiales bacterium]|nr:hypothetical protein [Clostridiales bacterium]